MTEFTIDVIKADPILKKLYEIVKQNHKVAEHTKRVLFENKNVKDFCEEARHFIEMPGKNPLYLHYDVASWYKHPNQYLVQIDSIAIYTDFLEYNSARLRGLHSTTNSDIPNIN